VQAGKKPPTTETVRIWTGTWNMGDAAPPYDVDLNAWMPRNQFDFYVVALQVRCNLFGMLIMPQVYSILRSCTGVRIYTS